MKSTKNRIIPKLAKPVAIDLFSGCGGLTVGLKDAGFRVIGAVELNKKAVAVYKANHRKSVIWNCDIRDLAAKDIAERLNLRAGQLDLLAGCPPCQGFSTITTNNGLYKVDDPRNDLISDFLRFIHALKPKAILLENVPGLSATRRFARFYETLERLHYKVTWRVLNVSDYGVPQRRKRLMLMAARNKKLEFADKLQQIRTVRDAIAHLERPSETSDSLHKARAIYSDKIKAIIRKIPRNGGSRSALGKTNQLACHKKSDGFRDIYGRMAWEEVSPTITSGCINPSKGRFLHPTQNRAISLREAALLQGFPETYRFDIAHGRYPIAEMIGNAIPPPFVKIHARALKRAILGDG